MLADLFPLFAALAAAVFIYIARERHRRRTRVIPAMPDITMAEAWRMWLERAPEPPPESVPEQLLEVESNAAASNHPRQAIRAAALESAALELHLDAIVALSDTERQVLLKGYTPEMDGLLRETLRAYRAECGALRLYQRLKYDDAVPGDWFDHFVHIAGPYIREKVRLSRDYLLEVDEAARRFAELYDKLLDDLRREMLKTAPKKTFPPSDLPVRGGVSQ